MLNQAYAMDPFDQRCVRAYIACLVELGLKTELFYLGKYCQAFVSASALMIATCGY